VVRAAAALLLFALFSTASGQDKPNGLLLIAKPSLVDPNFRETVVLVTQTPDASTVGVILNRPTPARGEKRGETLYFGGPVMPQVSVALFASERTPAAPAFHVIRGVYLSMHPGNLDSLPSQAGQRYRLFQGFSAWAPGQLERELELDGWFVMPASAEIVFRADTRDMWRELLEKVRGGRADARSKTAILSS
jgi:putative transcriptional regulator